MTPNSGVSNHIAVPSRIRSVIAGTGSYLPPRIMTNHELENIVDTSDEWIRQRSGIIQRHIADKNQATSDLALEAAKDALKHAQICAKDLDGIIVATSTPDRTFPAVAVQVQAALGLQNGPAFDLQAVCSGFIYALSVADSMLRTGLAKKMLVVGAEKFSSILDWQDRSTCVLFGDGAGAIVLEAQEQGKRPPSFSSQTGHDKGWICTRERASQGSVAPKGVKGIEMRGIHSAYLHANGAYKDILYVDGGVSTTQTAGHVRMNGREVFRNAVEMMSEVVRETLAGNGITADDIDWLIPHQANIRIIESTRRKLNLPPEKVVVTVDRHGNTSAASIPLALDVAVKDGRIKRGHLILLEALGAGLTWGSVLARF